MKLGRYIFDILIDLFSTVFLWLLIWTGAVLSLINSGNKALAAILFLSGIAWVYREIRNEKKRNSKRKKKSK